MSITIGKTTLRHGLILAPMAGVADSSFRAICRRLGAEYTVTEMLSAKALCYEQLCKKNAENTIKTAAIAKMTEDEKPCAVQLFGAEPEFMAEAAKRLESGDYRGFDGHSYPAAIDINMGCPVHKVVSNGEGSALMKSPRLAGEIVKAICRATSLPVTVKIRAGWDADSKNAPELAKIAEASGASLICVHGRTRDQFYSPGVDRAIIAEVKRAVKIPVIANGDIFSGADAISMLEETDCDGLAIGRGSLGNPWIFSEIAAALEGREYIQPTVEEKLSMALSHASDMIEKKGLHRGIAEARPHMARYIKGLPGAAAARDEIMRADTLDAVAAIFDTIKNNL